MKSHRSHLILGLGLLLPSLALAQNGQPTGGPSASVASPRPLAALASDSIAACYVPASGTIYRIGSTGLPTTCLATSHIKFSWSITGPPGAAGATGATG